MAKNKNYSNKNFASWTQAEVEKQFKLNFKLKHPVLDSWLASNEPITEYEKQALKFLREKAFVYVTNWNETELTAKLISPIFELVNFDQIKYSLFLERSISGTVNGITINGKADMMIATGRTEPESPYFFLQEFKKERENSGNPIAQMLLAMLVAQQENESKEPLYGSYVHGRYWFFAVLLGNDYALSNSYVTTHEDDLQQVIRILKSLKKKIERLV